MTYKISENTKEIRLDKAISILNNDLSRAMIQKLIESGKITVNGTKEKNSYKTKNSDIIQIEDIIPETTDIKPQNIPLDIVYEDRDILVINKQKGLVIHPGNGNKDGTLVNAVMARCNGQLSGIGGKIRPGIVHRLDKDTSGLLIVAKNDKAHISISNQIKEKQVKKTYVALVRGNIEEENGTIDMPIGRSTKNRLKMEVTKNGKPSITHFKVIERFEKYTLLEVVIETGRTHQIRVHMAKIGHPVIGDTVYSNGKSDFSTAGQILHSKKIEFIHPTTNKKITLETDFPDYFAHILKELGGKKWENQ